MKDKEWSWGNSQANAFEKAKVLLTASTLLTHFDSRKELILSCDASPYGVEAVLSHKTEDGEKPVAYASRSLATAEGNYSQLDKERLAIIYLESRNFTTTFMGGSSQLSRTINC